MTNRQSLVRQRRSRHAGVFESLTGIDPMVDFQSRDTDRGYGDDEDDETDSDDAANPTDEEGAEQSGQTDESGAEPTTSEDSEEHQADEPPTAESGDSADHDHSGGHDHAHAANVESLGVAVVTVSTTRTRGDDPSGDVIEALVEATDHEVLTREIIRDDLDGVQTTLLDLTGRDDVDVVVTTGGTGVTPDDVTVEGARPLFDRELPGFGELFRILSYEEIGTRAMASRATAGMVDGVPVFCLPGSEAAARLGTEELVVEEMAHLVGLARRND
jgi:molybdenum cofactor biosynthesis protein B